jgi:TetR/AcrR family transcriptional regulator
MAHKSAGRKSKVKTPVRERLLRAATALFARSGYDGTTVDAVVKAAKVNKRMVYHYFGDKEELYQEVLTQAYHNLEVVEVDVMSHGKDVDGLMEEIVQNNFYYLRDHPEFTRLLLWENLNGGKRLARAAAQLTKDPMLKALDAVLRQGIEAGKIRADMDARHLLISLIGLCQVYSSNRYTLSQAMRMDLGSVDVREAAIKHVTRLLLDGIKVKA